MSSNPDDAASTGPTERLNPPINLPKPLMEGYQWHASDNQGLFFELYEALIYANQLKMGPQIHNYFQEIDELLYRSENEMSDWASCLIQPDRVCCLCIHWFGGLPCVTSSLP
jgi:hypothetical protein